MSCLMDNSYYHDTSPTNSDTVAARAVKLQLDDPDVWWLLFYKGADWGAKQVQEGEESFQGHAHGVIG